MASFHQYDSLTFITAVSDIARKKCRK